MTSTRSILRTAIAAAETDDAELKSFKDAYGRDNAIHVGDRLLVAGHDTDDSGNDLDEGWLWTTYTVDKDGTEDQVSDTQWAATDTEAIARIADWIVRG